MLSAFWPLALFFVFSSLAFGCMEGWSIATCEVVLFLGAALVGWNNREFWSVPKRLWLPALLVVVLIAIGLLQLVPLPASWWAATGSDRYTRYTEGAEAERLLHTDAYRRDPFGPDADKPLPAENWTPLTPPVPSWIPATFTPAATSRALLALAAGLCLILLLERLAVEGRDKLRRLAWVVGGLGLFVALVALAQHHDKARTTVLWIRESKWAPNAFGPFVNPNHGGAFVNLTMPLLYYLLWRLASRQRRRADCWGIRILALGCLTIHAVSLAIQHSQGALLSLAFYPVLLMMALPGVRRRPDARIWGAAAYGTLLVGIGLFGWWTGFLTDHGRLRLAADSPTRHVFVGNGLGSFQDRFLAVVKDQPLTEMARNTHLEDEYAETAFEGGVLPAALALLLAGSYAYLGWQLLLNGSVGSWFFPAIFGEVLHAALDFTIHAFPITGALLLVGLLGMLSFAHPKEAADPSGKGPLHQGGRAVARGGGGGRWAALVFLLAILAAVVHMPSFRGDAQRALFQQGAMAPLLSAERALQQARPLEALATFRVALLRCRREGREDLFERIRFRMLSGGKALAAGELQRGWPLLADACVLSRDFTAAAERVEGWVLEGPRPQVAFVYPLTNETGERTAWGTAPQHASLQVLRCLPGGTSLARLPGAYYNHVVSDLPRQGRWSSTYTFRWTFSPPAAGVRLEVQPLDSSCQSWTIAIDNLVRWDLAQTSCLRRLASFDPGTSNLWSIDRLVGFGNERVGRVRARVIRYYEPAP